MNKDNTLLTAIAACKGRYEQDLRRIAADTDGLKFVITCEGDKDDTACGVVIWRGATSDMQYSHFLGSLAEVKYRLKKASAHIDLIDVFNKNIHFDERSDAPNP